MKVLILFLASTLLCFVSCSDKRQGKRGDGKRSHGQNRYGKTVSFVRMPVLMPVIILRQSHMDRTVEPICQGMEACMQVCEYLDLEDCQNTSSLKVVEHWLNRIDAYAGWEQTENDLKLIATKPEFALFLQAVDSNHEVLKALFNNSSSENCPVFSRNNVLFSRSPHTILYLLNTMVADIGDTGAEPQAALETNLPDDSQSGVHFQEVVSGEEQNSGWVDEMAFRGAATEQPMEEAIEQTKSKKYKVIVDGSVTNFNMPLFVNFAKKCLNSQTQTFAGMAAESENTAAVDIANQVIEEACGENDQCVRLTYCETIDSDSVVWNYLPEAIREAGCAYDSFSGDEIASSQ